MNKAAIVEKIRILGDVRVVSPLAISTGQSDGVIDSMIMRNGNGQSMIPGTSIAGVLRHIIRASRNSQMADLLFGYIDDQPNAHQSMIVIDDITLENAELVLRDGVAIDGITGTAIQGGKYDYEAVDRGATGKIQAEITLRQAWQNQIDDLENLAKLLADQLACGISLGGHTSKGLGQIACQNVMLDFYDFHQPEALQAWLTETPAPRRYEAVAQPILSDDTLHMEIDLAIKGSLIIGTETDIFVQKDDRQLNKMMLRSRRKNINSSGEAGYDYVIPGTSIKGVVRKQAEYICRHAGSYSQDFLNNIMGYADKTGKTSRKSRLHTQEVYLKEGVRACDQTHVRIDRFTGGHMDSGLFTDQPIWQEKPNAKVMTMTMSVEECTPAEAGLMLLLLKDIWTGQVAFGGDKAVGSGVLQGLEARIMYQGKELRLEQTEDGISAAPDTKEFMERLTQKFVKAGEEL